MNRYDTIETERLLLRPFAESDLEELFDCCRDPEIGGNAGWPPHKTIEESRIVLETVFLGKENVWAITDKATGRLVGSIGLIPDPKRENPACRMIGYWVRREQWGRGLATEAAGAVVEYGFSTLAADMLSANCYPHNERSRRVLERCGFVYEGTLHRANAIDDGRVLDNLCFYQTREMRRPE